ncbi:MAG: carboxymuconolactone decarboxylase family protein [Paludibacteraceae bacterium]|nr:carboxymuconolactone decarboxylase family protein [Paludibacteraceae bacterium]
METTTSALPERVLYLCACVAWAAKGDLEHLETVVPQALDHGVTINELKDAFAQLYAYAGFPRSLNALGVLEKILEECTKGQCTMYKGKIVQWTEGKPFVRPAVWDDAGEALRTGTAMQTRDEGGTPWDYTFCPQADYYMKSHLFGDIYASDQLTPAVRELVTVAALSAMDGVTPQFEGHKECAVFMGNTPEQVAELCRWLSHVMNAE